MDQNDISILWQGGICPSPLCPPDLSDQEKTVIFLCKVHGQNWWLFEGFPTRKISCLPFAPKNIDAGTATALHPQILFESRGVNNSLRVLDQHFLKEKGFIQCDIENENSSAEIRTPNPCVTELASSLPVSYLTCWLMNGHKINKYQGPIFITSLYLCFYFPCKHLGSRWRQIWDTKSGGIQESLEKLSRAERKGKQCNS